MVDMEQLQENSLNQTWKANLHENFIQTSCNGSLRLHRFNT